MSTNAGKERRIVIEPVRQEYELDELLEKVTSENQHKPVDFGVPVGKEIW